MHLDPQTHLSLHHARTDRVLRDPRRALPPRARPPGRLRRSTATVLRRLADSLVADPAPERGGMVTAPTHRG